MGYPKNKALYGSKAYNALGTAGATAALQYAFNRFKPYSGLGKIYGSKPSRLFIPTRSDYKTPVSNTMTMTNRRKKKPVQSTPVNGYVNKFKKPRKAVDGDSAFAKFGSVKRNENHGTLSAVQSLYIGHSTIPSTEIQKAVCRAIVKKLFYMAGVDINNFNDKIFTSTPITYVVSMKYYSSATSSTLLNVVSTAVSNTTSFATLADNVSSSIDSSFGSLPVVFQEFSLHEGSSATSPTARMLASDIKLDFEVTSKLLLQNNTKAGFVADADQDENVISDSITNNPLTCQIIEATGINGFHPQGRNDPSIGTWTSFFPNETSGLISQSNDALPDDLLKIPSHTYFRKAKKNSWSKLNPGQIKTDFIKSTHSMFLNDYAAKFAVPLEVTGAQNIPINIGKCRLLMLEKVLDTAGEQNIVISYQLDQAVKCKLRYSRNLRTANLQTITY